MFPSCVFGLTGIVGGSILVSKGVRNQWQVDPKSVHRNIALDLPLMLDYLISTKRYFRQIIGSSFSILNTKAGVIISIVFDFGFFKEHFTERNWIEIELTLIAIYLVTFA